MKNTFAATAIFNKPLIAFSYILIAICEAVTLPSLVWILHIDGLRVFTDLFPERENVAYLEEQKRQDLNKEYQSYLKQRPISIIHYQISN